MRVTTELWISSVVRRAFSSGGYAVIARRGAAEAGTVMILVRDRFGETTLYGPAPQTSYDDAKPEERRFVELLRTTEDDAVQARIDRELRFDPDVWVLDLDVDQPTFASIISVTTP